jgi:putative nucleotidyltransferase with HDIG domain
VSERPSRLSLTPPRASDAPPVSQEARALLSLLRASFASASYVPPALPSIITDMLRLSADPDVDLRDIRAVVERDPLVTARVLRLAKSAIYGNAAPVQTLDAALVRLGMRQLASFCAEAATRLRVFRAPAYEAAMELLAKHSSAVAHTARHLASRWSIDPEFAFLAGLLHDVGIAASFIVLADAQGKPGKKAPLLEDAWAAVKEANAHSATAVFRAWALAPEIGAAARNHHADVILDPLSALVALSDVVACEAGYGLLDESVALSEATLATLHVTSADLGRLVAEARELLARVVID